jgi:hypothetical protein
MALVLKDRVKQTAAAPGTGTITLGAISSGFQAFSAVGDGNVTYFAIVDSVSGAWEVNYGTYTASGTTLTRNATPLSSSAGGALVNFTNQVEVFVTYPSENAVWRDTSGVVAQQSFGAITATSAALTTGTVSTTPTANTDIANKNYVDGLVTQGISYHEPVFVESPNTAGNLTAIYNQPGGAGNGVGATLTNNGTKAALTIDGVLMTTTKRVLIYNQTNAFENGVYTVTTVGTPDPGGTNWVLTRATDADTYGIRDPDALGVNDAFFVTNGNTGAGETYVVTTTGVITFGTTNINFAQISSAQIYNAGTGLTLSPATTFNIANTTVSANTYGSAALVPVFAVNAQGQLTSVTNTSIAINGSAVTGAITGQAGSVANALTAGTYLTSAGTYDGSAARTFAVDATEVNTASKVVARDASGNFAAGTITAALSGNATTATTATNVAGGGANRIPYNTAAGTTSFVVAPTTAGTYLGWDGSAFTYSAVTINNGTLTLAVSGTGLSGSQTFTANQGTNATFTVASNATDANTASTIVARDASGNFSAGTITASLSGNASTATSATTATNATNVAVTTSTSASAFKVPFANTTASTTGNYGLLQDDTATFTYNPSTNTLIAGTFSGALSGNATTATTAGALTTGNNYQVNSLGVGTAASGTAGEIRATNNITAYYSDERLKTKIGDIDNALDKVRQITTMIYHANETAVAMGYDASVIEVGVTAQSVQAVQPEVVVPAPIDEKYWTVRYERLVPLIIEAIKELDAQVQELRNQMK